MAAIASDSQTTGKDFQSDGGCQWNFTDSDLMKTLDSMDIYSRLPDDKSSTSSEYLMQEFFPSFKLNQSQNVKATPILPQYLEIYGQPINSTTEQKPTLQLDQQTYLQYSLQPELQLDLQPILQHELHPVLQPISVITEDVNPAKDGAILTTLDSSPFPVIGMNQTNSSNDFSVRTDISIRTEETISQRLDVPNTVPNLVQETTQVNSSENVSLSFSNKILENLFPNENKSAKIGRPRGRPRIYNFETSNCHKFCSFNVENTGNKRKLRQPKNVFNDLEAVSSESDYKYAKSCSLDVTDDIRSSFNIFSFPPFSQRTMSKNISPTNYAKNEYADEVQTNDPELSETDTPICSVTYGEMNNPLPNAPFMSSGNLAERSVNKRSKKKKVTIEKKTDEYWVKRQKNNESAKRSRDARRMKENQIYFRTKLLERMCAKLSRDFQEARKQIDVLKQQLVKYEMCSTSA